MAKIVLSDADHPHQTFEELIVSIWRCEADWRKYESIDRVAEGKGLHKCKLPVGAGSNLFTCGCGTAWKRDIWGGGWTTA